MTTLPYCVTKSGITKDKLLAEIFGKHVDYVLMKDYLGCETLGKSRVLLNGKKVTLFYEWQVNSPSFDDIEEADLLSYGTKVIVVDMEPYDRCYIDPRLLGVGIF